MRLPSSIAESCAAAGESPCRLDGRDHLDLGANARGWAVVGGTINVFAAPRRADGSVGRRTHLGTVAPGGFLPGLEDALAGGAVTLVAVPDGPASVLREPRSGVDGVELEVTHHDKLRASLDPRLEGWGVILPPLIHTHGRGGH